jgi:hypothetical protein
MCDKQNTHSIENSLLDRFLRSIPSVTRFLTDGSCSLRSALLAAMYNAIFYVLEARTDLSMLGHPKPVETKEIVVQVIESLQEIEVRGLHWAWSGNSKMFAFGCG